MPDVTLYQGAPVTSTSALEGRFTELSATELSQVDALWRAANYLSVGQIYLMANLSLKEPL